MVFSPVDRIFTRLGASDQLMEGKSTFFIELEETLSILKDATDMSLCLIDELGRGTSTFDGISIAHSCLKYLVKRVRPLLFFSTHYHTICIDFRLNPALIFNHMGCVIHPPHSITHTYKLMSGPSANSFGINVAQVFFY